MRFYNIFILIPFVSAPSFARDLIRDNQVVFEGTRVRVCFRNQEDLRNYQNHNGDLSRLPPSSITRIEATPLSWILDGGGSDSLISYEGHATLPRNTRLRIRRGESSASADLSPLRNDLSNYAERVSKRFQYGLPGVSASIIEATLDLFSPKKTREIPRLETFDALSISAPRNTSGGSSGRARRENCLEVVASEFAFESQDIPQMMRNRRATITQSSCSQMSRYEHFDPTSNELSDTPRVLGKIQLDHQLLRHPSFNAHHRAVFLLQSAMAFRQYYADLFKATNCIAPAMTEHSTFTYDRYLALIFANLRTSFADLSSLKEMEGFEDTLAWSSIVPGGIEDSVMSGTRRGITDFTYMAIHSIAGMLLDQPEQSWNDLSNGLLRRTVQGFVNFSQQRNLQYPIDMSTLIRDREFVQRILTSLRAFSMVYYEESRKGGSIPQQSQNDADHMFHFVSDYLVTKFLNSNESFSGLSVRSTLTRLIEERLAPSNTEALLREAIYSWLSNSFDMSISIQERGNLRGYAVDEETLACNIFSLECLPDVFPHRGENSVLMGGVSTESLRRTIMIPSDAVARRYPFRNTYRFHRDSEPLRTWNIRQ